MRIREFVVSIQSRTSQPHLGRHGVARCPYLDKISHQKLYYDHVGSIALTTQIRGVERCHVTSRLQGNQVDKVGTRKRL